MTRLLGWALVQLLRMTRLRAGVAVVYHGLATTSGDPRRELVAPHGVDVVEAELRYLARAFAVVDAVDLPRAVAERRRGGRFPVAITFDDDLESHVTLALPVLRRVGVRATFFVTGATEPFWWQKLQRVADASPARLAELCAGVGVTPTLLELARHVERLDPSRRAAFEAELEDAADEPVLEREGLRALVDGGMTIGFHTRDHSFLPSLDDVALAAALNDGRQALEHVVGRRIAALAYPHGAADERVASATKLAGFAVAYTGRAVAVRVSDDPFLLGRFEPSRRSSAHFALQLAATLARAR
jgi:peptidoglycan/xylan/chitin deacetylase (PgdA/CDA1 family)